MPRFALKFAEISRVPNYFRIQPATGRLTIFSQCDKKEYRIKSFHDFMKRDGVAPKRKAKIPIHSSRDREFWNFDHTPKGLEHRTFAKNDLSHPFERILCCPDKPGPSTSSGVFEYKSHT
jgi:hypothetical protein